jgi:hypothetical protein
MCQGFWAYNYRIMKKYLAWSCVLALVSIFVTCQKEKYTHDSAAPPTQSGSPAVASGDKVKPQGDSQKPQGYLPRWETVVVYRVFGWPEGATVLALFLTLITIADQTQATQKSAAAAENGILLMKAKERARLTVTPIGVKPPGVIPFGYSTLIVEVTNNGYTIAENITADVAAETDASRPDPIPEKYRRIPDTLKEGGTIQVEVVFTDERDLDNMPQNPWGKFIIRVVGVIEYRDYLGDPHKTPFSYRINPYKVGVSPLEPGSNKRSWVIEGSEGWIKFGSPEANKPS